VRKTEGQMYKGQRLKLTKCMEWKNIESKVRQEDKQTESFGASWKFENPDDATTPGVGSSDWPHSHRFPRMEIAWIILIC